jgi:DNA polymerase theta
LAAGVNLPAGRVVIRSLRQGGAFITVGAYRQMCGRAGRAGKSDLGESFVLCESQQELGKALQLVNSELPPVMSAIDPKRDGGLGILRTLLEGFVLGLVKTLPDCLALVKFSLFFTEQSSVGEQENVSEKVQLAFYFLLQVKCIEPHPDGSGGRVSYGRNRCL